MEHESLIKALGDLGPNVQFTDTTRDLPDAAAINEHLRAVPAGKPTELPYIFRGVATGQIHNPQTVESNGLPCTNSGRAACETEKKLFFNGKLLKENDPTYRNIALDMVAQKLNIGLTPTYSSQSPTASRPEAFLPPGCNTGLAAGSAHITIAMRYALKRFLREYQTVEEISADISKNDKNPNETIPIPAFIYIISTNKMDVINVISEYSWRDGFSPNLQDYELTSPQAINSKQILGYYQLQINFNSSGDNIPPIVTLGQLTLFKRSIENKNGSLVLKALNICHSPTTNCNLNTLTSALDKTNISRNIIGFLPHDEQTKQQLSKLIHNPTAYELYITKNQEGRFTLSAPRYSETSCPPLEAQRHTTWQQHPTKAHFIEQYNLAQFYKPNLRYKIKHDETENKIVTVEFVPPKAGQPIELNFDEHALLVKYREMILRYIITHHKDIIKSHQGKQHTSTLEEIKRNNIKAFGIMEGTGVERKFSIHFLILFSPLYDLPNILSILSKKGFVGNSDCVTCHSGQRYLLFKNINELETFRKPNKNTSKKPTK